MNNGPVGKEGIEFHIEANVLRRQFKAVGFRHSGPGKSLSNNFVLSDKVAWREIKCRPKREPLKQAREREGGR